MINSIRMTHVELSPIMIWSSQQSRFFFAADAAADGRNDRANGLRWTGIK